MQKGDNMSTVNRLLEYYSLDIKVCDSLISLKDLQTILKLAQAHLGQDMLYNVDETRAMFLVQLPSKQNEIFVKFGYARRSGLPEEFDFSRFHVGPLRLDPYKGLFEASHILIKELQVGAHRKLVMCFEYNYVAPRIGGFRMYTRKLIANLFERQLLNIQNFCSSPSLRANTPPIKVKTIVLLRKDIAKILRQYRYYNIKRLKLKFELDPSHDLILKQASEISGFGLVINAVRKLLNLSPLGKELSIEIYPEKNHELDINIQDIIDAYIQHPEILNVFKNFIIHIENSYFMLRINIRIENFLNFLRRENNDIKVRYLDKLSKFCVFKRN